MIDTADVNGGRTDRSENGETVLRVTTDDIATILRLGSRDFRAAPLYGLGVAGIYTLGGWLLVLLLLSFGLPYLVYPLAAGFALIAPFIATAFYAISRCLERNEPLSWAGIGGAVWNAARRDLGWMALITGFTLFIWMDIAALLFFGFLGLKSYGAQELLREIFTTPTGLLFLAIGNAVGAAIAFTVFSFSVTSFPMLFDRDVDFVTAMVTSVKVVLANRMTMAAWCATITVLMGAALLTGLLALPLILPILCHASWHLYRRAVSPLPGGR